MHSKAVPEASSALFCSPVGSDDIRGIRFLIFDRFAQPVQCLAQPVQCHCLEVIRPQQPCQGPPLVFDTGVHNQVSQQGPCRVPPDQVTGSPSRVT